MNKSHATTTTMQSSYRSTVYAVMILLLIVAVTGCAASGGTSELYSQETRNTEFRIGPADVLSISILNQPNMDRTVTVRPDGMISFPLLDEVPAAGRTPVELEEMLTQGLSEFMQLIPGELTVVVDEVHSYTVSVLGQVRTPGRFEFQNNVTVLDALAQAGGLNEFASGSRIVILRTEADGVKRITFDYDELLSSNPGNVQLALYPGDIVMVP
jgi:polysaccharide biosynthesis/export protein